MIRIKNHILPWPRKGEELFKADEDWKNNARLNLLQNRRYLYVEGYKRAADVLVEHVMSTQSYQDFLVYPIGFLYRQYIELQLKEIIDEGNQLLDRNEEPAHGHEIGNKLWPKAREIIEELWPEGSTEDLDAVEDCIHQFAKQDSTSQAFRYDTDKSGHPTLSDIKYINLRNLADVMERLSNLLDGVSDAITVYLENKREMERYNA